MPIKPVSYISIESDENYYNTKFQINKRKIQHFTDKSGPSKISGSTFVVGLFDVKSTYDNYEVYNSTLHATSSTVVDDSGNSRKILSPDIDYFASGSLDAYKNGIEISQEKHWVAGFAKITAGNPGHLWDNTLFGVNNLDIISEDTYYEIDVFDPVAFIVKGRDSFTYPIVTSDVNQLENRILNGIIEPFPIRPVISNFSINFPFEPQGTRGEFEGGNSDWRSSSDSIVSIDYSLPKRDNRAYFLDAADVKKIAAGDNSEITASLGPPDGYFNTDENTNPAFEDVVHPRGEVLSSTYDVELISVVNKMTASLTTPTYVDRKRKSFTCGFDAEYSERGADSIVYMNSYWNVKSRDNRRQRQRNIMSVRDSESFIKTDTEFNDNSIIFFNSGSLETVEYPIMFSLEHTGSHIENQYVRAELFKQGSITVRRGMSSDFYESPLRDSILSVLRRQGDL